MNGQEIKKILARLESLERWKKEREETQLTFPLDNPSTQIVQMGVLLQSGGQEVSGAPYTNDGYIPVRVNGKTFLLMTTS